MKAKLCQFLCLLFIVSAVRADYVYLYTNYMRVAVTASMTVVGDSCAFSVSYGNVETFNGTTWAVTGSGNPGVRVACFGYNSGGYAVCNGIAGYSPLVWTNVAVWKVEGTNQDGTHVVLATSAGASTPPPPVYKQTYDVTNSMPYTIRYQVIRDADGSVVATYDAPSGTLHYKWVVTVPDNGTYSVRAAVPANFSDGGWIEAPLDSGDHVPVAGTTTPSVQVPTGGADPTPAVVVTPPVAVIPSTTPTQNGGTWTPTPTTVDTERLDKATYRQGVDRIAGGLTGIQARQDTGNSVLNTIQTGLANDRQARADEKAAAIAAANQASSSASTAGTAAAAQASSLIGTAPTTAPSLGTPGDYASLMTVTMPVMFGGKTVHLNPMENSALAAIAHAFRTALAWLVLVKLGAFVWSQMGEWIRGFSTARQAQGNTVAAGTGAQATALIAAGIITAAVVVAITALIGWSFGDITLALIKSQAAVNPLAGFSAPILGFLSEFFPIATIISALIARMTFNLYAASVFATAMSVIRFVVP